MAGPIYVRGSTQDGRSVEAIPVSREDQRRLLLSQALGFTTENFPRHVRAQTGTMVSGTIYWNPYQMFAGETISSIWSGCNTAGTALTLVKFGIATVDPALTGNALGLLATSADVSGSLASVGSKQALMISPYTASFDQVVFFGAIAVGSTGPGLDSGTNTGKGTNGRIAGTPVGTSGVTTGQSDLVGSQTVTYNGNGIPFWFGVT